MTFKNLLVIATALAAASLQAFECQCETCKAMRKIYEVNRFNPQDKDIIDGFYVRDDNRINANPSYIVSGWMDISDAPEGSLLLSNSFIRFVCFYDADKKYIECHENQNPAPIPKGAAFARMSVNKGQIADLTLKIVDKATPQPSRQFVNDICLPSQLWLLSDTQNDLFVQPFIKRWRPYDDFVRFSLSKGAPFLRRLNHVASITQPVDDSVLTAELINGDEFATIKRVTSTIHVGVKGKGEKPVSAQIIGDSFTHGTFFKDALLNSGYVPNLQLVGLLKVADKQYSEGRGGWTLNSYFNIPTRPVQCYHGFMQPDNARYWGAREFWVTAWQCVRGTQPKGFEPTYSCARFNDVVNRFDEATGTLLNPQAGDLQYSNEQKAFLLFDGEHWVPKKQEDFNWSFDYAKYLEMWNIQSPDFLFVLLGLNDFRGNILADFTSWGQRITLVKDAYLKTNPKGKFVICIPCSTCGSIDNVAGDFTPKFNAAMWRFRNWLIQTFDKREKDGFYLLDAGINTDNDHGFMTVKQGAIITPFEKYNGTETLSVQSGTPHPYPNYPAMGLPFAAFIQYFRDKE